MNYRLKIGLGLLLLLLATRPGWAQEVRIDFEEYELDNGLHVILHEDHSTPIVVISLLYHVGSKDEKPDRTGFAHFFEHLMFEGTEHVPRGQYDKIVEGSGGYSNAFTTQDQTYYFVLFPSNYLERALWLESERLLHAQIDPVGIETQREVVKEERKLRYESQPYGSFQEELSQRAFKQHPYRWQPIGSAQYIDEAQLEEFIAFYKTYYVPENATLTIAGDVDPAQTRELVKKYFGPIPKGGKAIPRPMVAEMPLRGEVRDTVFDKVELPGVFMGYRVPEIGSDDYYALSMLVSLLSDGESSRFTQNIVNRQQKAVQASAYYRGNEDPGLLLMFGIASLGTPAYQLEAAFNDEIERVKEKKIGEREYQKLLNLVENDFVESKSSLEGIAQSLPYYHVFQGNTDLINTELKRYRAVKPEDLQRVAQTYLKRENRVILYYLPQKK
jgi:zinc protease